jgi:NADH-quinone oxidoreductase subunit N
MPANLMPQGIEMVRLLPELLLIAFGTLIMVLEAVTGERPKTSLGFVAVVGLLAAMAAAVYAQMSPGEAFSGMLVVDGFTTFFRVLVLLVGVFTVLASYQFLTREGANSGEYYALVLFSVAGQSVMVSARELIMIFIGLEISSIASYVMAGYLRDDKRANEAAVKYFLLGSFATAFLLYGVAWVYGATGSTDLAVIRDKFASPAGVPLPGMIAVAAALMFVGLGFKVSGAPFQMWAPDVYQGAPSPVSGFLSAGPKAAAFAVMIRVFMTAFEPISARWEPLIWISALMSMTIGNFAALTQTNIKRMLAYSSIAHAGYVLVAVAAHSQVGVAAAMFYLASYALMNVGAFAIVTHISRKGERLQNIEDFAGLGTTQPGTAALFSIFLLSLIGVPLTGGFFGKFYIFKAALDSHLVWLTVLGLLNSAVAAYYYLRVLVVMYMREPAGGAPEPEPLRGGLRLTLVLASAGVLALGVVPGAVLDFATRSAVFAR